MPTKKGTTMHHRRTSSQDPMWMELRAKSTSSSAVTAICTAVNMHSAGKTLMASLLKTIIPMEHVAQD
eukprot:CAMPEP_0176322914 /NCGR_PEP_ID=MMETSP0121_2-20121125/72116_1 /TAXON_ID=160619 /ORGANISM="Kryptoperidinium foliaceum, Strain CCMP 1326" /LENGTH=67 /DNA_ID=CAMNT_0017665415 /DNA_START=36 /DNA_END=236 /DNA_ORIENTATION=+